MPALKAPQVNSARNSLRESANECAASSAASVHDRAEEHGLSRRPLRDTGQQVRSLNARSKRRSSASRCAASSAASILSASRRADIVASPVPQRSAPRSYFNLPDKQTTRKRFQVRCSTRSKYFRYRPSTRPQRTRQPRRHPRHIGHGQTARKRVLMRSFIRSTCS